MAGMDGRMSLGRSEDRVPVLDGLRAVSILLVLACHLLPLGPKDWHLNDAAGAMGMSLFFALSGFLITSGLMRNGNVQEFAARRLVRILPLAYLYTAIVFLVFAFDPHALLWTALFAVNYLTEYLSPGWTQHFWSLCVEIHFYLAIALVVLICGQSGLWVVWPACLAVTLLRIYAGPEGYLAIETHLRVDEILSGACVATIFVKNARFKIPPGMMAIALLLWAILLWALSAHPASGTLQYVRPYATALLLLSTLTCSVGSIPALLGSAPLRYIATVSYALYIVHPATAYGWMSEGDLVTKYLLKRPMSFILTFALAHFSTFYWERPWQTAVKRWLQRRRPIARTGHVAGSTLAREIAPGE